MKEMPCGEGVVTTYDKPEAAARVFPAALSSGEWFGFAEVDIEVPEELWPEFEEFPPLFINRSVPDNLVPQHMHDYLKESGRKRFPDQKKLLGVLSAKKILLYASLLQWYLDNGLKLTAVYRTIDYEPCKIFEWFVKEVADNRRKGDADKEKALLAEVFKLLGNSAYGKFIGGVERQKRTLYTRDKDEVDKHLRSAWFDDLEEIGDAYKIEMCKSTITIDRPFQIGIVVYQLANSTTSSSTTTLTGETSNSFRWTAFTSPWHTTSSRTQSSRATQNSSRKTRSPGWLGTSGATKSPVCSSSRSRAHEQSPYAASATTWRTRPRARPRCPPRVLTSARTSCAGNGTKELSRAVETWRPTGVSGCKTGPCTPTNSASSG